MTEGVEVQRRMFPSVWFDECSLREANVLLDRWGHRMGPVRRPCHGDAGGRGHVLVAHGEPSAVCVWASLIRAHAGGGLRHLTRENTMELARLCAATPHLCRVALRLFREFVWRPSRFAAVLSYQDEKMHTGNLYRFDGWARATRSRAGGKDRRSGRPGRHKWIWVYPPPAAEKTWRADTVSGDRVT